MSRTPSRKRGKADTLPARQSTLLQSGDASPSLARSSFATPTSSSAKSSDVPDENLPDPDFLRDLTEEAAIPGKEAVKLLPEGDGDSGNHFYEEKRKWALNSMLHQLREMHYALCDIELHFADEKPNTAVLLEGA
ncbi:hypothetical protein CcaCcLH18_12142 [Colletotrichum camelliae]|nr:hypothetical protein CcaCcLH18_12142 [Colletotrichum camelliae]